ncbi:uncharacterized protein LOC124522443 [Lynx rufus]|uniref:uncharacterized protein LOC124522443 n=1 Tax=Lynx rufus TaxID=61384 RepID=UPI001F12343A|nr:uncharacterized protein LOC124522443 [Lynx rufus]
MGPPRAQPQGLALGFRAMWQGPCSSVPEGWVGTRTQAPGQPGGWQLLSGGQSPVPTRRGRMGGTARMHRKWACSLPTGRPPISQPVSAPASSTVSGRNDDLYLVKVKPKDYVILYVTNRSKSATSLMANLLDRRENFRDRGHRPQTGGWCFPAAGPRRASPGPELHRGAREVDGAPPLTPGLPFRAQTCPHLLCCPFPDLCPHGQRAKKWGLRYTGT